mmetsp:Transcript_4578/g.12842  ORF Transcript_4578/g.12842 Transcript_4578/m.12842 type:complete len:291 (+) Transcript_4578:1178-2050(+)
MRQDAQGEQRQLRLEAILQQRRGALLGHRQVAHERRGHEVRAAGALPCAPGLHPCVGVVAEHPRPQRRVEVPQQSARVIPEDGRGVRREAVVRQGPRVRAAFHGQRRGVAGPNGDALRGESRGSRDVEVARGGEALYDAVGDEGRHNERVPASGGAEGCCASGVDEAQLQLRLALDAQRAELHHPAGALHLANVFDLPVALLPLAPVAAEQRRYFAAAAGGAGGAGVEPGGRGPRPLRQARGHRAPNGGLGQADAKGAEEGPVVGAHGLDPQGPPIESPRPEEQVELAPL